MLMAIIVGVVIGAIAGIARGSIDAALMWLTDLFVAAAVAAAAVDLPVPRSAEVDVRP